MVDVFEIAPAEPNTRLTPASFAYAGQEARIVRYQHLLSKLSGKEDGHDIPQGVNGVQVDWLDDANDSRPKAPSVKSEVDESLVGTFADAAAAMS